MKPIELLNADFTTNALPVGDFSGSFTIVSGRAQSTLNTPDYIGSFAFTTYQNVQSVFKVQDGAGIFCSCYDETKGVFFEIKYVGTATVFTLEARIPSNAAKNDYYMPYVAEIPM